MTLNIFVQAFWHILKLFENHKYFWTPLIILLTILKYLTFYKKFLYIIYKF